MTDGPISAASLTLSSPFANQTPQKRDLRPPDDEEQIQVDRQPPNQEMSFVSLASERGMSPQLLLLSLDRRLEIYWRGKVAQKSCWR